MSVAGTLQRIASIARKEFIHIARDPQTLFFTLFIPVVEMFMLGYAINTNIRNISTVVLDQAQTQESRELLQRFVNTDDFAIVKHVYSDAELNAELIAGRARVGIKVPEDYSRSIEAGETAQLLVLVDGSESRIAGEAINVGNALALRESLELLLQGKGLPVESRPRVLFNPDMRSANFFIPGLLVVMCQMMAIMLAANAIVREKENGTLEQLFMTPVRAAELIVGKLTPYLVLTFVEFCFITFLMRTVFQVPIHGHFVTLLTLALPFYLAMLGVGLWISTRVSTREAAGQAAMGTILPSIFLSGYVFPIDSMPPFFWWVAQLVPTTWMIDAARGVILRGAGWADFKLHTALLCATAAGMILLSSLKFRKQLT